jgi:hypothetical protein
MQIKTTFFLIASATLATAHNCLPDILLDDFSNVRMANVDGAIRNVNLRGGDYGGNLVDFSFTNATGGPNTGFTRVTARTPAPENFFFFKVNPEACFDLTRYNGIRIDLRMPAGSDSKFTLTQKVREALFYHRG